MCGIAGIINTNRSPEELGPALSRMEQSLVHRGPDQGAVRLLPEMRGGLAVRRLSLVDLEHGDQPLANEDGTVVALLNGEIYNHSVLREELLEKGHQFLGHCDTEVLPHLYEECGDDFVERLEGMFGLAVFDLKRRRLLLARDGPGIKPLYYADTPKGFLFASEAKALFASGLISAAPDKFALDVFLGSGFIPAPMTAFDGVRKLRAGEMLTVDEGDVRVRTYWDFRYRTDDPPLSDEEYTRQLEDRLDAAVERMLRADTPVGAFLSGGWDSTLTATFAARRLGSKLKTFSIVFPENESADESKYSRLAAKRLGADHAEIEYRNRDLPALLPSLARHLDEPTAATPSALTFALSSLAGGSVKAVITGEGADELFGGYLWYRARYPYWMRYVVPRWAARLGARYAPDKRIRRGLRVVGAPSARHADAEWMRFTTVADKKRLLRPEWAAGGPDKEPVLISDELYATCSDSLQRRLASDIKGRLPEAILFKADKTSMAHSLEIRPAFLDPSIIDLAERLPSRLKFHQGREKIVVGNVARKLTPPKIANRRKQGLDFPARNWLQPELLRYLRRDLFANPKRGPFRPEFLESQFMARMEAGKNPPVFPAVVVMLQLWWNEFIEPA